MDAKKFSGILVFLAIVSVTYAYFVDFGVEADGSYTTATCVVKFDFYTTNYGDYPGNTSGVIKILQNSSPKFEINYTAFVGVNETELVLSKTFFDDHVGNVWNGTIRKLHPPDSYVVNDFDDKVIIVPNVRRCAIGPD